MEGSQPQGQGVSLFGTVVRDLGRLQEVIGALVRHGFGGLLAGTPLARFRREEDAAPEPGQTPAAARFAALLAALGPTFIKLGQILSMRQDLLPPDYIEALRKLQDSAPEVPFEEIRATLEAELGRSVEEAFAAFNRQPLGVASIAQVHRATTHDGREVVVKVQRAGIERVIRSDMDLLYIGARLLEARVEELRLIEPSRTVMEFERELLRELNFAYELDNLVTARQFLDPARPVSVPAPLPELSSSRVLTMEHFAGRSVRTVEPGSPEARAAAQEIVHAAARQVFHDGFFHGDPHAGNILINDLGQLCMIDCGLMGRLSVQQRRDIVLLIVAAMTNNSSVMATAFLRMGEPTERVQLGAFKEEIQRIRSTYLEVGNLGEVQASRFAAEFMASARRHHIRFPPHYMLLVKALVTLEGLVRWLDPEVDLVGIGRRYVGEVTSSGLAPEAMLGQATAGLVGLGVHLERVPTLLEQVLHDYETGNLQIQASTPRLDLVPEVLTQSSYRQGFATFAGSMAICAAILLTRLEAPGLVLFLFIFCLSAAVLVFALLLIGRLIPAQGQIKLKPLLQLLRRDLP